ncbi:hypothetical protein [Haloarcula nitratireducens]|uniref:Uncharacterized protein n=1 Tax=Haloarcula nitratireducens TaxID=2487749 RepID=A0AAW4PK31_9EURY|nr:hypothetical protein [Halomicroarcula nitratireducens]MBX0297988.1 hypothetical protein [Halomicroarcula nitratireducens]
MRRRDLLAASAAAVGLAGCTLSGNTTTNTTGNSSPTASETPHHSSPQQTQTASSTVTPTLGGSLNGRPRRISDDIELVEKSNTTVIHAFLDVRKKYEQGIDPRDDPDITALQRVSQNTGVDCIIALKWNFTGNFGNLEAIRVPSAESSYRQALFEYATELLTAIGSSVTTLVLGNEPIWETPDVDLKGQDSTLLSFTRDLNNHLLANYTASDPQVLVGAFNRLYGDYVRKKYEQFYQQLVELFRTDADIDGIDLHVHYNGFQQATTMLAEARDAVPDGTITVSEFSPVWRYKQYIDATLDAFETGSEFADRYEIAPETTITEYYETATDHPQSPQEMADFMEAMPWYNVNFIEDMYEVLDEYDVQLGTVGFLQDTGFRHANLRDDWLPFQINYLFQRGVIDSEDGAHPHYLAEYRNRT